MSHCPSCGRYIGPYEACPHCGATLVGRIPIRILKFFALFLASAGLVVLWLAATRADVPIVKIGQADATTNMAYVRLQGQCTRAPTYDPEREYLSFWIADDTGTILVTAYRAETREMVERGQVPALGDQIEVAGTLRVREDFLSLTLNAPEQLKITRAEPVDRSIRSIRPEDQYRRVRVRGQARSIYEPYQGLTLITVRDGTGSIPLAVSKDVVALSSSPSLLHAEREPGEGSSQSTLAPGQPLEVVASVSLYGDKPQLVPASMSDIQLLDQTVPLAAEKRIGELTSTSVGQLVLVRGTVTQATPFSSGVKVTLQDDSGTITVLLWQTLYEALPTSAALDTGAEIEVQGEIAQYQGELELIPELPADVRVLASAPPPVEEMIGALTPDDIGRVVTLRGTLGPPNRFSAGVKFPLEDGTGRIVLLLWHNVHFPSPRQGGAGEGIILEETALELESGAQVEVTGEIGEYGGELEIIPRNAAEISLLQRPARQTPPPTAIPTGAPAPTTAATLAPDPTSTLEATPISETLEVVPIEAIIADRIGERTTVEGRVIDAFSFSAGFKFILDDGTGRIALPIWHDVYDDCWDAPEINLGARLRASGEVGQYKGELQIQPDFGGDVKVIEGAEAWATPREIGSLSGDDEGQRVMIEGEIVRVESLSSAVKVFVKDDSGETLIFIWRTILNRVPNNVALGTPGSHVRVVGTVEIYKGNLEVVPTLPNDVITAP